MQCNGAGRIDDQGRVEGGACRVDRQGVFSADRRCRFLDTVPLVYEEVELLCKLAMPCLSSGV